MKLDRSTYEAWLLDRIEGNLTPEQERQLSAFLAANPDLEASTDELPTVPSESAPITWKDELKKQGPPAPPPDAAYWETLLVAQLEGDLTPEQALELNALFLTRPALLMDARRMAATKVAPETIRFPLKDELLRHFPPQGMPDAHHLTDFLIAAQEGDLTPGQAQALAAYLQAHPEAAREQRLILSSRVVIEAVVFPHKERLRKRETRVIALWARYAVAASIALLLGLAWWMGRDTDELPSIARRETPKPAPAPSTAPLRRVQPAPATQPSIPAERAPAPVHAVHPLPAPSGAGTAPAVQHIPDVLPVHVDPPAPSAPPDQNLAQTPAPPSDAAGPATLAQRTQATGTPTNAGDAVTLATLAANTVRREVINTDERSATLDGADALAAVDRGLNAITGGEGGLQVQHDATRDRLKLRLGKHFAISASTGR